MRDCEATFNNEPLLLPVAAPVFASTTFAGNTVKFGMYNSILMARSLGTAGTIKFVASQYLNTPYLWGGKSNYGIDCSGFTQQVFKTAGIHLLRDAYQQATQGEAVGFLQETRPGDLAFFDNDEGRITHVGIMLTTETIIHASGYVRVDGIDSQGITHSITGKRTHKLRIIKRLF
jgi:cell wall-associated NlpC family hydrolase